MRNLLILTTLLATTLASQFGKISSVKRRSMLLEPDVTVFKAEVTFELPQKTGPKVVFSHIVPIDYNDDLSDVLAKDSVNRDLKIQRVQGPSFRVAELEYANVTDYIWFEIDISEVAGAAKQNSEKTVTIDITEYYKRRRAPYPRRITILESQNLELHDSKYFLSPYLVKKQGTLYMLEKHRIVTYDESEGMEVVDQGIKYGPFHDTRPLSFEIIRLTFTYEEPYLLLKEAVRKIDISHWGNIALAEWFDLRNIGADLLGQFSRIDADQQRYGKNCVNSLKCRLPYYIHDLSISDSIGNMTSCKAVRNEKDVTLQFMPRFQVCGGWKADWTQYYSIPTKYHLNNKIDDPNLYVFNFTYLHDYDVLLTENYTVEITLPYGAQDIQVDVPLDLDEQFIAVADGTLDFFGRPKIVLRKTNVHYQLHSENISVTYRYDQTFMLIKPLIFSGGIFLIYMLAIILQRCQVNFEDSGQPSKEKKE